MKSPPSQTGRHREAAAAAEFVVSCEELGSLLKSYRKAAAGLYRDNFEALSAMYLTIMELWTVLDASAVNLVPLLREYAPGFPLGHFDILVLPKREQLERLARVEDYLARRRAAAGSNGPPWQLRSSDGSWSETCFPACYCDSSPQHQLLRLDITRRAHEVQKRATSFAEAEKAEAAARAASGVADARVAKSWRLGKLAKYKAAAKAAAAARAAAATATAKAVRAAEVAWAAEALDPIEATEIREKLWSTFFIWPLPENETAIKVVVFEIEPPAAVTAWRESTWSILAGFHGTDPNRLHRRAETWSRPPARALSLCHHGSHPLIAGSRPRRDGRGLGRFQLGFLVDRSRGWHDAVPQYESSTTRLGEPLQVRFIGDDCDFYDRFSEHGFYTSLSESLYASTLRTWSPREGYAPDTISPILQPWILGTTHTSNDVLAAQSQCPENMTLDELRAFGSLRAGPRLQWHNILLQLTIPSLDLNRPKTFFLVMQAANEAGPRGEHGHGAARSTHAILGELRFGDALLGALEDALDRVERKWESDVSLCILVSLAVRLLSMSSHRSVQDRSLAYLQRLRHNATDRARRLAEQLRGCGAADEEQRGRLGRRAYTMALISAATFDVGASHATSVLSDRGEPALLIEASILAAENTPPSRIPDNPTTPILDVLLHRWHRLSYNAEPLLKDLINQGSPCLDMAARAVWPSYARGTEWSPAPAPHEHVLVASMPAEAGSSRGALSLRYNLLTGHFTVGGSHFSSLPAIFHQNALYRRMFGSGAFTVIPSYLGSQGMQYMATSRYHGHDLHLAMLGRGGGGGGGGGGRLVVRSEKKGATYELIPPEKFGGGFPSRLLDGYVHWLVLGQERIEFRPLDMAWQTLEEAGPLSDQYYVLDFSAAVARLTKANPRTEAVVAIGSETASCMHTILGPLESPRFIDIALDQGRSVLKINLPRLRLSFNVRSGGTTTTMASEQYRGYYVDKDQFLGTLTGLTSKLVLRRSYSKTTGGQLDTRLVLVPVGEVSLMAGPKEEVHARWASRAGDGADHVQHHAFRVDAIIGCLRDNNTLSSKLFLCHLHAITTHCLPDKLTGRTGTEEALRILSSAAVQSASQLQQEDVDRLRQIANLRPFGAFLELVASIPGHSEPLSPHVESLVRRAATRTSAYRIPQYGAAQLRQPAGKRADVDYAGYDSLAACMRELEVCRFTRHMMHSGDQPTILHPIQAFSRTTSHPFPVGSPEFIKPRQRWRSTRRAEFGIHWILSTEAIPIKVLCTLLQQVNSIRRGGKHRYQLILFLAGVLFSPIYSADFAQLLLAVASAPMVGIRAAESGDKRLKEGLVVEVEVDLVQELTKTAEGTSMESRLSDLVMHINALPRVGRDDTEPALRAPAFYENMKPARPRGFFFTSVQDMFGQLAPVRIWTRRPPLETTHDAIPEETPGERLQPELPRLLDDLRAMARLEHEQGYVDELGRGIGALQEHPEERRAARQRSLVGRTKVLDGAQDRVRPLLGHLGACRRAVAGMFTAICHALGGDVEPAQRLLPTITPILLLEQLSARYRAELSSAWLRCLVDYAVSLTELQRAERMVRAADDGDVEALARELRNPGHQNWDPLEFPDWLLLEIELGILIRPLQALVASAMMTPPGARNHVVQLNMGEGKSSVIVPMVAAALADSKHRRLVRVIVARPQSKQMAHTLVRALGGLLHRRVYQLPPIQRGCGVARSLSPDLRAQWIACLRGGGVLLAQPEHLLSLRLSGLETLLSPPAREGGEGIPLELQYFLDGNARDVVDESDDILGPRSELTYTMGSQRAPDLGPARWHIIQSVLGLVAEVAPALGREHPDQLEVGTRPEGHFPRIRVLNEAGADLLADRVVQRIRDGGLATFTPIASWQRDIREAAFRYISQLEAAAGDVAVIQTSFATDELLRPLFLLRGLVAHRVLGFALQKRWRVDFGRAGDKRGPPTGLAVPFRAKDSPSPRSEFSHPDVVIILTCLTYYYGGLRNDEVACLIERLLLSGDGEREYLTWVQSAPNGIPQALGQLGAFDGQDRQQSAANAAPHLRHLGLAVNYYLSSMVFAREMRQYPQKLSESAWSLCCDPSPSDLEEQRHTNAMVLNCLLRTENTVRDVPFAAAAAAADMPTWQLLLRHVVDSVPPIRVLIDAGAQIVELGNAEIARRWLDLVPAADASAAVFFNSDEDMCVTARDGTTEPFLCSPYADGVTSCLIYLDEAHARGTDLRLPNGHRAAVTLGPGMTKDRLIQACMRMRGLGRGQSVVFFVPTEIRRKITALRGIPQDGNIEVADVLAWSISETWHEARRLTPLWVSQGLRHQRQQRLWDQAGKGGGGYELSHEPAARFLESESSSLTLREQYHDGFRSSSSSRLPQQQAPPPAGQSSDIERILARHESLKGVPGGWPHRHVGLEEEQVREVLVEAEAEVEGETEHPERPLVRVESLESSPLHKDVEAFVATGTIPNRSPAFIPALRALAGTSIAHLLEGLRWPPDFPLFVTTDFSRTVRFPSTDAKLRDAYQRPVQWIATAPAQQAVGAAAAAAAAAVVVVLSPCEANALMPTFRAGGTAATLHLFAPRTSLVTRSVQDLLLYTTPAPPAGWQPPRHALVLTLLLFAGQLYLRTYDDYVDMCRLLGVPYRTGANYDEEGGQTRGDDEGGLFGPAAVPFFRGLFKRIRHPTVDISNTDVGSILGGNVLPRSAFSGRSRAR